MSEARSASATAWFSASRVIREELVDEVGGVGKEAGDIGTRRWPPASRP